MSEQTYTIAPLVWKRRGDNEAGHFWTADSAWGQYAVYSSAYRMYLADDDGRPAKLLPTWDACHAEYHDETRPVECRTIAECKAAAEAYHRERVASLLVPATSGRKDR